MNKLYKLWYLSWSVELGLPITLSKRLSTRLNDNVTYTWPPLSWNTVDILLWLSTSIRLSVHKDGLICFFGMMNNSSTVLHYFHNIYDIKFKHFWWTTVIYCRAEIIILRCFLFKCYFMDENAHTKLKGM